MIGTRINIPGGGVAIVCSRDKRKASKPCSVCRTYAGTQLCDGPGLRKGRTCDVPLCPRCSLRGKDGDTDFCPKHRQTNGSGA
jgi:hypothetical protein